MKILILVGSGTVNSRSLSLGKAIAKELEAQHADVEIIDLLAYALPVYNMTAEKTDTYDQKTKDFLTSSYAADAFVWVTPIYHNSFSGLLKNALDWQHSKFNGQVVGLASNGGNRSPQAADHLMIVARAQHLIATTTRVCTDNPDYDDQKNITSPEVKQRITAFATELVSLTSKIASK